LAFRDLYELPGGPGKVGIWRNKKEKKNKEKLN
jgi:hypothetical protein